MEVSIKKLSTDINSNECILSKSIFDALKLDTKTSYNIHFGLANQISVITFTAAEEENMHFPENIFNQLQLLEDTTLNIWKNDTDIFLGPVVGIFVSAYFMKSERNRPDYYVRQHIRGSLAQNCLSYFFSANDVDWSEKKVRGLTYIPELNRYAYHLFPLPNVVYDRVMSFNKGERSLGRQLRREFKRNSNIKLINNLNMLAKWDVCKALAKHPEVKKHVPETIFYTSFDDVLYMLNKNELIFIKSDYGSGGTGVLSVEKLNNKYKLNYYYRGAKEALLDNINEVQKFVTEFVGNRRFIVQQGIRLLSYKGSCMDIRMFIMKNEAGKWESIFKGTRIAKEGFALTNIHAGGVYAIYEQLYPQLKEQYSSLEVPSAEKLEEVTHMLASCIEKELGALGEIGMDIGIDDKGEIWIIEANSKPGKRLNPKSVDINGKLMVELIPEFYRGSNKYIKILPQAQGIFKYAKFLTGVNKL